MTLSYDSGHSNTPLLGETISANLRRTVETYPDSDALISPSQNYRATYAQLWVEVEKAAKSLLALGIEKGDRLGIWSANRYEWVIVQYAAARVGAILVNLYTGFKLEELGLVLKHSEVSVLIMTNKFRNTDCVKLLNKIKPELRELREVVSIDDSWEDFLTDGDEVPDEFLRKREGSLSFDDPISIQYTGGTTGYPKGATLSHHNMLNNGYFIGERLRYTQEDKVCIPVPFNHCFGMVLGSFACTTHGAAMVITGQSFEPGTVLDTVQKEQCTALYGVPTMFLEEMMLPNFEEYNLSSLRTGILSGSQCPQATVEKIISKMKLDKLSICYGVIETSPISVQSLYDDSVEKRTSTVGKVHPHQEIKIVDPETRAIVPRNTDGELLSRGYSVLKKYWNNPSATEQAIDRNGWVSTGDIARMDEEGYITISGRIKDTIQRGGEHVAPFVIEDFLVKHPAVSQVYVIGVPDYKYGEEVMAWVRFNDNMAIAEQDLYEYCKGKIATYKIPKHWKFVLDFPTDVNGRVDKQAMRELSIKELELA